MQQTTVILQIKYYITGIKMLYRFNENSVAIGQYY